LDFVCSKLAVVLYFCEQEVQVTGWLSNQQQSPPLLFNSITMSCFHLPILSWAEGQVGQKWEKDKGAKLEALTQKGRNVSSLVNARSICISNGYYY